MCNGPLWGGVQSGVCALVGPVFGWRGCVYASYICLLVFQARKRREEARGLSLTRILCRPAMQRLRELFWCFVPQQHSAGCGGPGAGRGDVC